MQRLSRFCDDDNQENVAPKTNSYLSTSRLSQTKDHIFIHDETDFHK